MKIIYNNISDDLIKSFLKGRRLDDYGCTCRNELKNIGKNRLNQYAMTRVIHAVNENLRLFKYFADHQRSKRDCFKKIRAERSFSYIFSKNSLSTIISGQFYVNSMISKTKWVLSEPPLNNSFLEHSPKMFV